MDFLCPGLIKVDQAAGCPRQFQQAGKSWFGPGAHQQPDGRAMLRVYRLSQGYQQGLSDILRPVGLIEGVDYQRVRGLPWGVRQLGEAFPAD